MTALRPRLQATALAGSVLLALAASPLPGTALADTTAGGTTGTAGTTSVSAPIPLDIPAFADVAFDAVRGRLFFSSGTGHDTVLVTDLAGRPVTTLTDLGGATGLAIGPHGPTLWVALADDHALAEVDLATLEELRRVPLPGQCPGDVAANGHHVVYGFSCSGYAGGTDTGGVGVFSGSDAQPVPRVSTAGPIRRPLVDLGYEWPHRFVAAESRYGTEPGTAPSVTQVFDVVDGAPEPGASIPAPGLQALAVHPWTDAVVLSATGLGEHRLFPLPGLADPATVPAVGSPRAAAWAWHGPLVTGSDNPDGPDVVVHDVAVTAAEDGTAPQPRLVQQAGFELGGTALEPGGLAVDDHGVRAYAVVRDGAGLALRVLSVHTSTTLTGPALAVAGQPLTLTGQLTVGDGPAPEGRYLRVERTTRTPNGALTTTRLADAQTGPDGTFTVSDTPGYATPTTYRVTYQADDATSSATWTVDVHDRLTISAPRSVEIGQAVTLTGTLRNADGTPASGRTVTAERYAGTGAVPVGTATTGPDGTYTVTDTPTEVGSYGYGVRWSEGTDSASARTSVDVRRRTATLAAAGPLSAYVGEPVLLTGRLTLSDGTAGGGEWVSLSRRQGTTTTALQGVVTAADGTFTLRDAAPTAGSATYLLGFASKVEQGSTTVQVEIQPKVASALDLSAAAPLVAGRTATLTGRLTFADGSSASGATVTVVRRVGDTLVEPQSVTTGPDGTYEVTTTAPAAGTATYTVRYAGDTSHAPATRDLVTSVALNPTSLGITGSVDRKKLATVVAQLGPTLVEQNRIVRITAQTNGGTPVLVVEGRVDANGRLVGTYSTTARTTTFTATFAGDGYNERRVVSVDVQR